MPPTTARTGNNRKLQTETQTWKTKCEHVHRLCFFFLSFPRIIYRVSAQWHAWRQPLSLNPLHLHLSSCTLNIGEPAVPGTGRQHGVLRVSESPWPRHRPGRQYAKLHHHHHHHLLSDTTADKSDPLIHEATIEYILIWHQTECINTDTDSIHLFIFRHQRAVIFHLLFCIL